MAHQYNFNQHMDDLRHNESKKKIVEDYERNNKRSMPRTFVQTTCYRDHVARFVEFVNNQNFCKPRKLSRSFDWNLFFALYCASTEIRFRTENNNGRTEIIINEMVGGIHLNTKLSELSIEDIVRLYKKRIEEHIRQQNAIDGKVGEYEFIIQARDKILKERTNVTEDTFQLIESNISLPAKPNFLKMLHNQHSSKGLFDFVDFINELRTNEDKKEIVDKYEKYFEPMPPSFEETECYKNYLSKFVPLYKEANIRLPEDLEDDFDWPLLFCLIAGSFSSTYEIKRPNKIIIENEEKNELLISASSRNEIVTKTLSELWSFQILRLFEIYIEEHLQLCCLIKDPEERDVLIKEAEDKIILANKIINDSSYEKKKPYEELMLYHYTSLDSFEKILSSNNLWATNLENEYDCWIECFLQVYDDFCLKDDCHTYLQLLDVIKRKVLDYYDKYKFYISCFCMTPDLREAWRRYTNTGSGICIGFNLKEINHDLYDNEHKIDLDLCNGEVEYNHNQVFKDVHEKIKKVLIDYKDSKLIYDDYIRNADKLKILEECCLRSFLRLQDIKDISTIKDKEFRYYWFNPKLNPSKEVRYFAKGSSLVQYVELSTGEKKLPIKEIIIGPAYNKSKEIETNIKEKLTSYGFNAETIKISHSKVNTTFL